jgi:hypothetical protein
MQPIPTRILDAAVGDVKYRLAFIDEWPEDEWISLDPDWDLNLSEDDEGKRYADIYHVVNEETQTDDFLCIYARGMFILPEWSTEKPKTAEEKGFWS